MRAAADSDYRVVIDEDSLGWCDLTPNELGDVLDDFANLLDPIADGRHVALMDVAYGVECWQSISFSELPYTHNPKVPRDARVRLARLLDKCRVLEPQESDIPQPIRVGGIDCGEPSWGVSHALARSAIGRSMSCLLVRPAFQYPSGWTTVERGTEQIDVHFLGDPALTTGFWRGVYTREPIPEKDFFALTDLAYPALLFASDLRIGKFGGSYTDVLPWLVKLLGTINDHFAEAVSRHKGERDRIQAEFSALGLDVSPESHDTKEKAREWAMRLVTYEGESYRCEWHGKRLWNHDRVHFSLPIPKYGNRILIGIFADHLPT